MKRHVLQYKSAGGAWYDAHDFDQSYCCYDTYDQARAAQEWFESCPSQTRFRVVTLSCDGVNDDDP